MLSGITILVDPTTSDTGVTGSQVQSADFRLLSPAPDYVATSPDVYFSWEDPERPEAAYDLHIYDDAARTQKVVGTNGVVFDTNSIGSTTNWTFTDDPSYGSRRYGRLVQFVDSTYSEFTGQEILFEYTAYTKPATPLGADFDTVKAIADSRWSESDSWYTSTPMRTDEGYHSMTVMCGGVQTYLTTGDTSYIDTAMRIGQNWIDSGTDLNGDGLLDWWGSRSGFGDVYNYDHHEWRAASGIADILMEMQRTGYEGNRVGRKLEWSNFLRVHVWDKWAPGHSQLSANGAVYVSNRATKLVDSVGRWTLIALALDRAQAAGDIPASTEYSEYINSPTSVLGQFFTTYDGFVSSGNPTISKWTDGDFRGDSRGQDTQHTNELIYSIFRGSQVGYDFGGKYNQFKSNYVTHLNDVWFPTSEGFYGYAGGFGEVNQYHWSASHGHALGAAISPELQERWVDMFLNHEPTFTYNSKFRLVWSTGGLLWALAGNTI